MISKRVFWIFALGVGFLLLSSGISSAAGLRLGFQLSAGGGTLAAGDANSRFEGFPEFADEWSRLNFGWGGQAGIFFSFSPKLSIMVGLGLVTCSRKNEGEYSSGTWRSITLKEMMRSMPLALNVYYTFLSNPKWDIAVFGGGRVSFCALGRDVESLSQKRRWNRRQFGRL